MEGRYWSENYVLLCRRNSAPFLLELYHWVGRTGFTSQTCRPLVSNHQLGIYTQCVVDLSVATFLSVELVFSYLRRIGDATMDIIRGDQTTPVHLIEIKVPSPSPSLTHTYPPPSLSHTYPSTSTSLPPHLSHPLLHIPLTHSLLSPPSLTHLPLHLPPPHSTLHLPPSLSPLTARVRALAVCSLLSSVGPSQRCL